MSDFTLEDAAQLINYYKQKTSDLEYQVLQLQLQLNKTAHSHIESNESNLDYSKEDSKTSVTKSGK